MNYYPIIFLPYFQRFNRIYKIFNKLNYIIAELNKPYIPLQHVFNPFDICAVPAYCLPHFTLFNYEKCNPFIGNAVLDVCSCDGLEKGYQLHQLRIKFNPVHLVAPLRNASTEIENG